MQADDPDEHIRKLISAAMEERNEPLKGRFTFSRDINLGHLVVTIGMIAAAFVTFLTFHDSNLEHANRVVSLEKQQIRTDDTIRQLTSSQVTTEKAVTQLTWLVEQIQKRENNK